MWSNLLLLAVAATTVQGQKDGAVGTSGTSQCTTTDGSVANSAGCICGTASCTDASGLFCYASRNMCHTSGTTTTTTTSGTSGTSGTPCHPGNYRDPTGACNACAAGKSQPVENQPQCKDCPVHQYQDLIGSTSCKPCSSATAVGSTTCVAASGSGSASGGQWQGSSKYDGSSWTVPACNPCMAYATTDEDGSQAATEEGKMHYQQDSDGKCWSIE